MVQSAGGTEDFPCPRWSKSMMLYPREINFGVALDQRDVFVSNEFANMSQGRGADDGKVRVTACRLSNVVLGELGLGIGTVCYETCR